MLMTSPSRKYRNAMSPWGVSLIPFLCSVLGEMPRAAKKSCVLCERGLRCAVLGRFATSLFLFRLRLTNPDSEAPALLPVPANTCHTLIPALPSSMERHIMEADSTSYSEHTGLQAKATPLVTGTPGPSERRLQQLLSAIFL